MLSTNISTISDLRFKTDEVLAKADLSPLILFHRSTPRAVILSVEGFNKISEQLDDYYLALRAEEYEKEDKSKIDWVKHSQVKGLLRHV
ncbi:hypothetical protein COX03_02400 [Candidatus Woesebacteria bacterium CG22_combo_CG10-13_8_21_14_all_39_10]|uniref:Antitoxin n=4 Tax=Candidatus Woeseibacteriota TaxID=1752722 RepID=A0A2M7X9N3_9BACT|nr:MAG: hypothetical protein COX03_02400 [Candidatus Woesebacteria bacterium CG22_combo_CG10-13_8_21_14_all_39_10]PIU71691.1 MAG: hypothetical protein COS80_01975 [Candidatus Woesebacteria bacterium CG06_land_8_20_14_3_00_39_27]PIZ49587.1 MAG: hypothetical protein COY29_01490 [Candidatus Woesebacteria bacterium CG_4_10_14_0_2_um_filter_39_14]PJA42855.1 MAG: hypothetical protein CO176_01275 [Candidatus Woesebacteria bacterium CG_4_9_14_3_um_filter_39_10]